MYKKLNQLSFVIGLFFTIMSVILLLNNLLTAKGSRISLYTAVVFLIFGVGMMVLRHRRDDV